MTHPKRRADSRRPRRSTSRTPKFPKNVLVLEKTTKYDELVAANDTATLELVHARHESVEDVLPAHQANQATLDEVHAVLRRRRIKFTSIKRDKLGVETARGVYDMMVVVGGDGSVLDASHFNKDVPILGVNSSERTSHGHFCKAFRTTFAALLDEVRSGKRQALRLMRLELTLDGRVLPELVLNEVCMADPKLGATSRYIIHADEQVTEQQMSDGLFIGTAAGCTGWMHSYDADVLPVEDRQMQFLARGLIINPGQSFRFIKGKLPERVVLRIVSKMERGLLKIDGQHIEYKFPRGSELVIRASKHDLLLYCDPDINVPYEVEQRARREAAAAASIPRH